MAYATLEELLITSLSATGSPSQLHGIEFNANRHQMIGNAPIAVRYLHNLCTNLHLEYENTHEQYSKSIDDRNDKSAAKQRERCITLKNQISAVSTVKWTLIHTSIPIETDMKFENLVILENWKIAGVK